ncbi:HpcH/HpaI aldolase family protein [Rhodovibrionaceae bacterium A322]
MQPNPFKASLAARQVQIGLWSSLCSPIVADILSDAGFDWVLVDSEHSPNEPKDIFQQLVALDAGGTHPVVRVPWNDPVLIKRVMDIGARSLLIPMVQTAEEAQAAVAACRYPPEGVRGVATSIRANRYGRTANYHQEANAQVCVLVQVETKLGLDNITAIAATEGVDGVFIGPADLSADLGYLGDARNPVITDTIKQAFDSITAAGKPAGFLTAHEGDAKDWIKAGFTFVAVGSDTGLIAKGASDLAARFRT